MTAPGLPFEPHARVKLDCSRRRDGAARHAAALDAARHHPRLLEGLVQAE